MAVVYRNKRSKKVTVFQRPSSRLDASTVWERLSDKDAAPCLKRTRGRTQAGESGSGTEGTQADSGKAGQ